MADAQPDANVAPNPAAPQTPGSGPTGAPAEQTPAAPTTISLDSFSDEEKKYLESQGVNDFTSADAIKKIINHAQASQKSVAEYKNKLDSVSGVINPTTPTDPNPFAAATGPSTPTQQPTEQPQTQGLDPVAAYNLSMNLANQYDTLKEDLTTGKFYQDMAQLGIPLMQGGSVNMSGLLAFAQNRQDQNKLQAQIEELTNKPGGIPDAKPNAAATVAEDAPMTKQMAQAILIQDPNHPRAVEAQKHLQSGKA